MARTYALAAPYSNNTGKPWAGPRSSDTGSPIAGVGQESRLTLSGTPQPDTFETFEATVTGTIEAGDEVVLTLDAVPYNYVALGGDDDAAVAAGIALACVADPNYDVTSALGVVTIISKVAGPWAGSVVASAIPFGAGDIAFSATGTVVGATGNTFGVDDGTNTFEYTVAAGNTLGDCATALAALIALDPTYASASAIGPVITVTGLAGAAFSFTDISINNLTPGGAVAYALISAAAATVTINSPFVMSLTNVDFASIWCDLVSGTSCVVTPWFYDKLAGVWAAQTPVTVNADKVIQLDVRSIANLFVEQSTFVGAGVVEVTCVGSRTSPGYNG